MRSGETSTRAAGRGRRRALSRSRAATAGRCADGDSRRPPGGRVRRVAAPNAERYLKSPEQIEALFPAARFAARWRSPIAARSRSMSCVTNIRKSWPRPARRRSDTLTRLTWEGARARYPAGIPDKVRGLIEHELQLIAELQYEAYFLTVWDLVRFARSRTILCQGRGSAANSAVCYCLGVTSVDPDRIGRPCSSGSFRARAKRSAGHRRRFRARAARRSACNMSMTNMAASGPA